MECGKPAQTSASQNAPFSYKAAGVRFADDAFDKLIMDLWRAHLASMGELARTLHWGSRYWHTWYNGLSLYDDVRRGSTPSKSALRCSSVREPSPSRPPRQPEEISGSCVEGDSGGTADGFGGRVENEHATRDTVVERLSGGEHGDGEQTATLEQQREEAVRCPVSGMLPPHLWRDKEEQRVLVQSVLGGPCSVPDSAVDRIAEHDHNAEIAKLIDKLGAFGAGRRAILKAIAEQQGVNDEDELERLIDGSSSVKLKVPLSMRPILQDVGLGKALAPINVLTLAEPEQILLNETWKDIEFEVALDSGSVVHVCAPEDCPGYRCAESPGSRRGQEFLMGDGGTIPKLGPVAAPPQRRGQGHQVGLSDRRRNKAAYVRGEDLRRTHCDLLGRNGNCECPRWIGVVQIPEEWVRSLRC